MKTGNAAKIPETLQATKTIKYMVVICGLWVKVLICAVLIFFV